MGHTNSTANLALPQFIGTDKPTWLGDINSAFSDIDAYAGTNDAAVSGAVSDAASAVSQAASAVSTANAANTTAGNASTAATNAVGTANNAMSLVNQTNTKIGTLANLNTSDKTSIVNAINEVNAKDEELASITADGVKTFKDIVDELSVHLSDLTYNSKLVYAGSVYRLVSLQPSVAEFASALIRSNGIGGTDIMMSSASEWLAMNTDGTITDNSNTVVTSGLVFKLYK